MQKRAKRASWMAEAATVGLVLTLGLSCVAPPDGIRTVDGTEQEDIPVPESFELRKSHAPDYQMLTPEAQFRSWSGEYVGKTKPGEVVPWYLTQMKTHKWTYRGMEESDDIKEMLFEKGDEVAKIQVFREIGTKKPVFLTVVRAEVHPRGPEDFSVKEHLDADGAASIRPAGYRVELDETPEEQTTRLRASPERDRPLDSADLEGISEAEHAKEGF